MVLQQECQAIDVQAPPTVPPSTVASHGERRANTAILKLVGDGTASAPMKMPAKTCFRNSCIVVLSGTSNTLYANPCHDTFQCKNGACGAPGEIRMVSLISNIRFGDLEDGSEDPKNNGSNLCQG